MALSIALREKLQNPKRQTCYSDSLSFYFFVKAGSNIIQIVSSSSPIFCMKERSRHFPSCPGLLSCSDHEVTGQTAGLTGLPGLPDPFPQGIRHTRRKGVMYSNPSYDFPHQRNMSSQQEEPFRSFLNFF